MQFAVQLPVDRIDLGAEFSSAQGITHCARHVEKMGFDATFVTDHPAPEDRWLERGGHHSFDPFVALSCAAGGTTTLKLFTNILVLPYRNPLIVAKSVASLDTISNGRMIMGVGAGYLEGEFRACGVDMQERGQLMEEALQAMKLVWSGESFRFKGKHFQADGNTALPRPVQTPHPPIWMGGNSTAAMRRAAQYCDGWLPFPVKGKLASHVRTKELADINGLERAIKDLRQLEQQFERSRPLDICMIPFGLGMHSGMNWNAEAVLEQCQQLQALGVSWINISLPCDSKNQYFEASSWFAEEIISAMHSHPLHDHDTKAPVRDTQ
jgi:probable F420-dependent oxidoreductase